jgi:hypothetical protein
MSAVDVSPKKKKSSFSPGTSPSANLVKRSKIEDDSSDEMVQTVRHETVQTISEVSI